MVSLAKNVLEYAIFSNLRNFAMSVGDNSLIYYNITYILVEYIDI